MGAHISHPLYQESIPQRLALIGARCEECEHVSFPPKETCPECASTSLDEVSLTGRGTVHSYTIITPGGAPPEYAEQANRTGAFPVAIIELTDGPRITAQLTNIQPKDVTIGLEVRSCIRRLYTEEGVIRYGFKFEPA